MGGIVWRATGSPAGSHAALQAIVTYRRTHCTGCQGCPAAGGQEGGWVGGSERWAALSGGATGCKPALSAHLASLCRVFEIDRFRIRGSQRAGLLRGRRRQEGREGGKAEEVGAHGVCCSCSCSTCSDLLRRGGSARERASRGEQRRTETEQGESADEVALPSAHGAVPAVWRHAKLRPASSKCRQGLTPGSSVSEGNLSHGGHSNSDSDEQGSWGRRREAPASRRSGRRKGGGGSCTAVSQPALASGADSDLLTSRHVAEQQHAVVDITTLQAAVASEACTHPTGGNGSLPGRARGAPRALAIWLSASQCNCQAEQCSETSCSEAAPDSFVAAPRRAWARFKMPIALPVHSYTHYCHKIEPCKRHRAPGARGARGGCHQRPPTSPYRHCCRNSALRHHIRTNWRVAALRKRCSGLQCRGPPPTPQPGPALTRPALAPPHPPCSHPAMNRSALLLLALAAAACAAPAAARGLRGLEAGLAPAPNATTTTVMPAQPKSLEDMDVYSRVLAYVETAGDVSS